MCLASGEFRGPDEGRKPGESQEGQMRKTLERRGRRSQVREKGRGEKRGLVLLADCCMCVEQCSELVSGSGLTDLF